jgi:hypothetical protein
MFMLPALVILFGIVVSLTCTVEYKSATGSGIGSAEQGLPLNRAWQQYLFTLLKPVTQKI